VVRKHCGYRRTAIRMWISYQNTQTDADQKLKDPHISVVYTKYSVEYIGRTSSKDTTTQKL